MTNSSAALRLLIVYAIIIPVAILMGFMLTNPLDYGTIGFVGILLILLAAPVLIKWYFPIMVFGLGFPAVCFFLPGSPPAWQIVTILGLGIAIIERTLSKEKQFLSAPLMSWALIFTLAMAVTTMELTGGFHLHSVGGGAGGGKKYIRLFLGIAAFFALLSQGVPPRHRNLYIGLFFLSGVFAIIGDLFPFLPPPLNYINLMFPPSGGLLQGIMGRGILRLSNLANTAHAIMFFMLARYGLRNILSSRHLIRGGIFATMFILTMTGGFRSMLFANVVILIFAFFLDGLHRTRWAVVALLTVLVGSGIAAAFPRDLPRNIQRSMAFLPINIDPGVKADAEGSTEWRLAIWKAILPKVPEYLLLGKGYSLSVLDFESIGPDSPFAASARANASLESLAVSNDFHSGPLSTIICFGIWGCLSILAIMAASLYITYHNYRYGDPALQAVNTLLFAIVMEKVIHFFFIFGAYGQDVGLFARYVGFSVALNWGIRRAKAKPAYVPTAKTKKLPEPAGTPQPA